MRLVQPKAELWGMTPIDADASRRWIERAARVCYSSEDKITETSAVPFIERILKPKPCHGSVLEHSNIVLRTRKVKNPQAMLEKIKGAIESNFIFSGTYKGRVYIYGNYRAFMEYLSTSFFNLPEVVHRFFDGYSLITDPKDIPDNFQAFTACFHTDRSVSHRIVRHRHKTAFSQRSQRFCNESDLQIAEPWWFQNATIEEQKKFMLFAYNVEDIYRFLKKSDHDKKGHSNQEACAVLPNCTSTVLVVTAYMTAWRHFFNLRISSAADPGIHKLMESVQHQMCNAGYLKD